MAALTYENQNLALARRRVDWAAIWAGVFTFAAIWSVFGVLGYAVFASAGNSATARSGSGIDIGMSIWAIVLTIIAMYVAGRETGRLAVVNNRHDGLIHGMIMFGLSMVAAYLILILGEGAMSVGVVPAARTSLPGVGAGLGWAAFLCLFLGWLAAIGGASTGASKPESEKVVEPIRKVA